MMEFYEALMEALLEEYVHPQGISTEDVMGRIREERPEVFERLRKGLHLNESRPYIDVKSYHSQRDIDYAFRVLKAHQDAYSSRGPKHRDKLIAVQCAILHDRHGWKYEDIAKQYGWDLGSNVVSKYIRDGRRILTDTQPT